MSTSAVNQAAENSGVSAYSETKRKNQVNGKTIGKPELSEKAQKYYEKTEKEVWEYGFYSGQRRYERTGGSQCIEICPGQPDRGSDR